MKEGELMDIELYLKIVTTALALLGLVMIWLQLKKNTELAQFAALINAHKEIGTIEFRRALRRIYQALPKEIEQINNTPVTLVKGSTYNDLVNISTATLTDWTVVDSTGNILYRYLGAGWDNDSTITKYISDWDFGKDYLIHPLTTFDGTYGIYPNIDIMTKAQTTIQGARDKINDSESVLEDYI